MPAETTKNFLKSFTLWGAAAIGIVALCVTTGWVLPWHSEAVLLWGGLVSVVIGRIRAGGLTL